MVFLAVVGIGIVTLFGTYISVNNTCLAKEATLAATKDQSKSVYDNFWKKVKEVAQVPAEYNKGMAETYSKIMDARYKNSKGVMMNWIKEANPNFDASLYVKIQQVIESGRNDFQASQKLMIDQSRDYKTYVGQIPTNIFASLAGYPKVNWEDYAPVTSDETDNAFKTRKADAVNVFGNSGGE